MPKGQYQRKPKESAIHVIPGVTEEQLQEALRKGPALKVHIFPQFGEIDKGDGGIRRVVEGQRRHLHKFGIEVVDTAEEADVIAYHAECPTTYLNLYPHKAFVSMVHGFYWSEYEWSPGVLSINAKVMEGVRVSDAVIACSNWVANSIRRHTSRETHVIYHGIDADEWGIDEDARDYVLWNKTRPDPVCDPEPLNLLAQIMPNQRFISSFGIDLPNIELSGKLPFDQAKILVQKAGVYLATTRETFGIGTLEAMASGVPVVGFDYGGQAEFINHMYDGFLATPGNIGQLAEGVRWALENRSTIAPRAIAKARQFTWERACENYAAVFRDVYSRKKISPRTSIVITNYQLHDYLPAALDSVIEQSDNDWECIVVDDASPDSKGREIVKEYAERDPRIRLIANEKNVYLAEARNIGIREARGQYILPLDADDYLDPQAVSLLADALDTDRSISVAYGNVLFVDEDGKTPTNFDKYFRELGHRNNPYPPGRSGWPVPFKYEMQIKKLNLLPYCSMFKKEAWRQVGGYRRRCRTAEDADFWTRLSSYGFRPKMVTEEDTLIYRNRPHSMSRKQGDVDWVRWFSWSKMPEITPAGAGTEKQMPIPSYDPIIISVIIPVGPGHERYVHDAVDSVDAQSFRNWECIVVNDSGSSLPELPSWVRIVDSDGGSGPAASRNRGISVSNGRLFLPLDADDYLEPDALQFMYTAYQKDKEVIYTDFWQTDMTGKKLSVHECDDYDPKLLTGGTRQVGNETRQGMIHTVTALTPKQAWLDVGGYDEKLPAWEDWDFQLAIGDKGYCSRRIAFPLFTYRKHTGFRRDQNYANFEQGKEGILAKWGDLWKGRELMACGSCARRPAVAPFGQSMAMPRGSAPAGDAVLLRYIGNKQGAIPFRGVSRTKYWFASGEEKYVLAQDLPIFLNMPNQFEVVQEVAPTSEPILVAEGPPGA